MNRVALIGDVAAFYGVVEREPGILKTIEDKDFVETPLHVAASVGNTDLAVEILSLKPSFGKKLNPSGYSPLDMALRKGHRETVKQLIKFDAGLIGVRSRERKTPLHYVAETNDFNLVAEFLVACPTAIKEVTIRGETAVHLAVLRGSLNAFNVLMDWITRTDNNYILAWKDNTGNTVLHIAVQTRQVEVTRRLITEELVDLNDKNQENQTALEIVSNRIIVSSPNADDVQIQNILQEAGAWELSNLPNVMSVAEILTSCNYSNQRAKARECVDWDKGMTPDIQNAYLVVTVLILATTFQAVLSPPGGGWPSKLGRDISSHSTTSLAPPPMTRPNSNINTPSIMHELLDDYSGYYLFIFLNSFTFVTSLILTYKMLRPKISQQYYSAFHNNWLSYLLVCLMLSYLVSGVLMGPPEKRLLTSETLMTAILVSFVATLIFDRRMRNKLLDLWTKKDIIEDLVYKMEHKVRHGKYVA